MISYFSRATTKDERKWDTRELEVLALISATSCCGTSRARGSRAASLAYYQLFPYQSTKGETTRITDRDAAVSRVGSGTPA